MKYDWQHTRTHRRISREVSARIVTAWSLRTLLKSPASYDEAAGIEALHLCELSAWREGNHVGMCARGACYLAVGAAQLYVVSDDAHQRLEDRGNIQDGCEQQEVTPVGGDKGLEHVHGELCAWVYAPVCAHVRMCVCVCVYVCAGPWMLAEATASSPTCSSR